LWGVEGGGRKGKGVDKGWEGYGGRVGWGARGRKVGVKEEGTGREESKAS